MKLSEGIRKHGFRKWYERELLQSHACLALTFMCTIGVFAAIEGSSKYHTLADRAQDIATLLLCAAVGLWSLRRYLYLLSHAEAVANQADCPSCDTYARFKLVHTDHEGQTVSVRCSKCAHEWTIQS
jgi:predicted Zn finger-like uncharacterized protein